MEKRREALVVARAQFEARAQERRELAAFLARGLAWHLVESAAGLREARRAHAAGMVRALQLSLRGDGEVQGTDGGKGRGGGGDRGDSGFNSGSVATVLGLPLPSTVALWPCVPAACLARALALVARLTVGLAAALDLPLPHPLFPLAHAGGDAGTSYSTGKDDDDDDDDGGGGGGGGVVGGGGGSTGGDGDRAGVSTDGYGGVGGVSATSWGGAWFEPAAPAGSSLPPPLARCGRGAGDAGWGWAAVGDKAPHPANVYLLLPPWGSLPEASGGCGGCGGDAAAGDGGGPVAAPEQASPLEGSGARRNPESPPLPVPERGSNAFVVALTLLQTDVIQLCLRAEVQRLTLPHLGARKGVVDHTALFCSQCKY